MQREGYSTLRAAHPPEADQYAIGRITAASGHFYAWEEVAPESLKNSNFSRVPNGRSGTVEKNPAVSFSEPDTTGFIGVIVLLLKTRFADTQKVCWMICWTPFQFL